MDYREFINQKHVFTEPKGFTWNPDLLPAALFDWQRKIVVWALQTGCAALFEDCGLGKTIQQLSWAQAVNQHTNKPVIVLTPLAVSKQTFNEAEHFGIKRVKMIRSGEDVENGINIINIDRLHLIDASVFSGVVLDESSILKSYMGSTKRTLVDLFANTPYRLACTATPAPNDHLELGNHAEFLGVMQSYEMIARWFDNDSMTAGGYTLKPHAAKDFWRWVASWSVCISKPSDIGGDDTGFDLPKLNQVNHTVVMPLAQDDTGDALFSDSDMSATTLHKEKRRSARLRSKKAAELVAGYHGKQVIVWCDTNYEADELMAQIPNAIEVRGSMKDDERERNLAAFTDGTAPVIVTKPEIAGLGLNWQHSHVCVFVGLSFSFERFYQALRRQYRFGQKYVVDAHIITSDAESACGRLVNAKEVRHESMKMSMADAMKEIQMENFGGSHALSKSPPPIVHPGDGWTLYHGDCVDVTKSLATGSIGLSVYSPPFSNLYTYSDSMADMGNSADDAEFIEHYKFLIRDLLRVTIPGRLSVVHCKDMPMYKGRDGAAGLRDFPGMIIRAHEECGWTYHSRVTIWKDPVIEMQRTKNHGLLHKILCKDSSNSRQGMADYLIVFRKWVDGLDVFPSPVHGKRDDARFDRYVGEEQPNMIGLNARQNSINIWQRYASPVWFDIHQTKVLNNYRDATSEDDVKHICPLQLDVIERSVELWSNPGDLVYSPFNGIGSEGYVSIKMNRKYVGAELKKEYVDVAIDNLKRAADERDAIGKNSLFELA
jgi:DNA modification methylase